MKPSYLCALSGLTTVLLLLPPWPQPEVGRFVRSSPFSKYSSRVDDECDVLCVRSEGCRDSMPERKR